MIEHYVCEECGSTWVRVSEGAYVLAVRSEIRCRHEEPLVPQPALRLKRDLTLVPV